MCRKLAAVVYRLRPNSRCHHGRCALTNSARSLSSSAWKSRPVGVQVGVAIGHGPQILEHVCHIPRHADLIGYGMAGLSRLHGALDVNGEGNAAGRPGRIQQFPDGPHGADDDRLPSSTFRAHRCGRQT